MGIDEDEAANYIESFKSRYTGLDMAVWELRGGGCWCF